MSKYVAGAVAALIIGGLGLYSCNQASRADAALSRLDSVRQAKRAAVQQTLDQLIPQIEAAQDSAAKYQRQRDSAKRAMRQAGQEFSNQMEALLATADSGAVRRPQLIALREVHVEQMEACQTALSAAEAQLSTCTFRLRSYRDSIVPALRSSNEAERAFGEQADRLARPGFFTRMGQNLELVGVSVAVGAGIGLCLALC